MRSRTIIVGLVVLQRPGNYNGLSGNRHQNSGASEDNPFDSNNARVVGWSLGPQTLRAMSHLSDRTLALFRQNVGEGKPNADLIGRVAS